MRIRHAALAFGMCLFILLISLSARAQVGNQGSVEGTVTDPNGGLVPGAVLTLKNTATGATFTLTSNEAGLFRFPVVPVGTYELTAEKSGFTKVTEKDIQVTVGARINLNLSLPLQAQMTSVTVTGGVPVVETTRTQVSSTVNDRAINSLPTNGRNFINFVLLTPGVTTDPRLGDISFAGQRGTLNSLLVDGSDDNNTFFGQTTGRSGSGRAPYQFSEDGVAEFQVNSNAYSAELGRAGGAVINVVTKSGTNQFHGNAFEYFRDRLLNANDAVNKGAGHPRPPFHFNQFGASISGPIKTDRSFFLFGYDGQRNTQPNIVLFNPKGFVPATPFEIQGFNYLQAAASSWSRTQNQDVYLAKVDVNLTRNNLLSGRWNNQRFVGGNFENGGNQNALEHTGASLVKTDTVNISLTSTLTPTLINTARFTYLRDREPGEANSFLPEASVFQGGQNMLTVGRNSFSPRETTIKRGQWADTLSWVRGRHTLKLGADFMRDSIFNFFPGNFSGAFRFNCLENFGRSLARQPLVNSTVNPSCATLDALTEAFPGPNTSGPTTHPNLFQVGVFAQDEWRLRRSLTVNLGLRYDLERVAQPTVQNPALLPVGINTAHIQNDVNNVGPRIGFAWTPLANNRMVVRGGYGIFYGVTPSILYGTATSNNGISIQTLVFDSTTTPVISSYPANICGGSATAAPSQCSAPAGGKATPTDVFVFESDFKQPIVQQWSFGTEYEVVKNLSVAVTYLGVKGNHLQRTRDINLPSTLVSVPFTIVGEGTTVPVLQYSGPRPIAGFRHIFQFEGSANSIYHGLTFQITKRFAHNFQLLGSYTYGKVIDDNPDATAVVVGADDAKDVQFPTNPHDDHGAGGADQHQRFVLSGTWDLDYGNKLRWYARGFLGDWQLSGIFTAQTGQPYSALVGADLNLDANASTDRSPGTGRNIFRLPSTYSVDPRVTKTFPIYERAKFQFIFEAYNIFNRANIFNVNRTQFAASVAAHTLTRQSNFGTPNSTFLNNVGPRIIQLAAKVVF